MNILNKYNQRAQKINSLLCVGLDPDIEKVKGSQFEFCKKIIDATHEYAAAYKPNIAFFEARGDQGIRELKMVMEYLQKNHPDIFTICDCKRGDIGNTNNGYVTSLFDWFGFDAITLHPYLGREALEPFLARKDKVSIVLCGTSNPGAAEFQEKIWRDIAAVFSKYPNCMLTMGATYPAQIAEARKLVGDTTFLVPGVGAQGGSVEEVIKAGLNSQGLGLIINSSRGIIFADDPRAEARKLCEEIRKYIK